jgi:hypothetical protein
MAHPWRKRVDIFKDGRCVLYLGDCLKVMPALRAVSAASCVTDPPYGIGGMAPELARWDFWPSKEAWQMIGRLVGPQGRFALTISPHLAHRRIPDLEEVGWKTLEVGFWIYATGRPVHRTRLKRSYELVYFLSRGRRDLNIQEARGFCRAGIANGRKGVMGRFRRLGRAYKGHVGGGGGGEEAPQSMDRRKALLASECGL